MRLRSWILTILSAVLAPTAVLEAAWSVDPGRASTRGAAVTPGTAGVDRARADRGDAADRSSPATDPRLVVAIDALLDTDRARAGETIAEILGHLSPLARTHTVCAWAASPHRSLRLAVAASAPHTPYTVGLASAVDVLTRDHDPEVKLAAAAAGGSPVRQHA